MSLNRAVIDAILPPGALWVPKSGDHLDLLLDGIGDCADDMHSFLAGLATIRDPYKTTMLSDMEAEFGISPVASRRTETERRAALAAATYDRNSDGSLDTLQAKLTEAGFSLSVYANSPPVNPLPLISESFDTVCGSSVAICGYAPAVCGYGNAGELLVNGENYGDEGFGVPLDSGYWPLFFFVGGGVQRNGSTNAIEVMETANIPVARRDEVKRLILKYKPLHSWCGLLVFFT